jgi:hypothetical protein
MSQVIGFSNEYFTLWHVSEPYKHYVNQYEFIWKQDVEYIQNLSMDFETAKSKVCGNFTVDLELRGLQGRRFTRDIGKGDDFEVWQFTFGKLTGSDIRSCDDVWQLNRVMNNENGNKRRMVIARRRLIELGELVRYNWVENNVFSQKMCDKWWKDRNGISEEQPTNDMFCINVKRNYATPKQAEIFENKKRIKSLSGHFFNDGEKVTLKVKFESSFCYDTQFGTCFIEMFVTEDGKLVKYKGNNPPYLEDKDSWYQIKGTVEHGEYNGIMETRLKRIKVVI